MKNKLFTLLFAIVASIGMMRAEILEHVQIGNLYYNLDNTNQTAEITYENRTWENYATLNKELTIPSSVVYEEVTYNVISIGSYAFSGWNVESILISNNITNIGDYAFTNCFGLLSIEISNSVTRIGRGAFTCCSSLTSIIIPNNVVSIEPYVFSHCSQLTSIVVESGNTIYDSRGNCNAIIEKSSNKLIAGCLNTIIPDDITIIGTGSFAGIPLSSIVIPSSVDSIGFEAFDGCGLITINIPQGVRSIANAAFAYCHRLTSIYLSRSVMHIDGMTFASCENLTSIVVEEGNPIYDSRNNCNAIIESSTNCLMVGCQNTTIPNTVTSIGYDAFTIHTENISIILPNSVLRIGTMAFAYSSGLKSVTIPNSVTSIGNEAFSKCTGLTSITNHATTPQDINSNVFDDVNKATCVLYVPAQSVALYQAADGWREFTNILPIEEEPCIIASGYCGAEGDSTNLSWQLTCDSVLTISGSGAMADWASQTKVPWHTLRMYIKSIIISNGVTNIGNYAFYYCTGLMSLEIPTSVTSIGNYGFWECTSLTSITIPNGVTSIGKGAFYYCTSLTSITIPNSVTSISKEAFEHCSGLTSVTIPNSVTSIGGAAFGGTGLTSIVVENGNAVYDSRNNCNAIIETSTNTLIAGCLNTTIPNNVTSIGDRAFIDCSGLTSVEIPNSVISIETQAFQGCTGLTNVTIPNSVTSIGTLAFQACTGLMSVEFPNSITSIGSSVFHNCFGLTSPVYNSHSFAFLPTAYLGAYTLPDGTKSIAGGAFENCSGLTSVTIPSSVTKIGYSAFKGCSGLTSIFIPESVASIESYAFRQCTALTSITDYATTPQTISTGVFYNVDHSIPLYVPAESVALYQAADGWKDFTNILPIEEEPCIIASGYCGAEGDGSNLTWQLSCDSVLTISGTGAMADYDWSNLPWNQDNYLSLIRHIDLPIGLTTIGDYAFWAMQNITTISLPKTLKSIGNNAFAQCANLSSIIIPDSVINIGQEVFTNCTNIQTIIIPNSVDSIGNLAFWNCDNLKTIQFGSNLLTIGSSIFNGCQKLDSINVVLDNPNYCSINGVLFNKNKDTLILCPMARKGTYIIPDGVVNIAENAFLYCDSITVLGIPQSVTGLEKNYAFRYCASLLAINVDNNSPYYTSIDGVLFNKEVTTLIQHPQAKSGEYAIPVSVNKIANCAFYNCKNLTAISIPDNVHSVGWAAFQNCKNLIYINIPTNVNEMDDNIFSGCKSLLVTDSIRYADTYLVEVVDNNLSTYNIREGTKWIGGNAFHYCKKIKSVDIPNSVLTIGERAFYNCDSLSTVRIGSGVRKIGHEAFKPCKSLTSIICYADMPPVLTEYAFRYIDYSKAILYVPEASIEAYRETAGWSEFTNILSIEEEPEPCIIASGYCGAEGDGSNLTWQLTCDSVLMISGTGTMSPYSLDKVAPWAPYKNLFYKVVIGEGVTNLSYMSFRAMPNITDFVLASTVKETNTEVFTGTTNINNPIYNDSIFAYLPKDYSGEYVLPEGIRSIEPAAFAYCRNLTSIVMPNSLKYIRRSPFSYSGITNISLPEGLLLIDMYAFEDCSELEEVTIPSTVNKIDYSIFTNCNSLMRVSVSDANPIYDSRDNCNAVIHTATNKIIAGCQTTIIPESVVEIGDGAFQHCNNLVNIVLPDNLELIGNNAFWYCTGLKSITIPNPVTRIGTYAFIGCSSLMSVTIHGNNVKIFRNAFSDCVGLMSITCYATNPPALVNPPIFSGVDKSACTLYVPAESIDLYRAADGWKDFANILPLPEEPCIIASGYCGAEGDSTNLSWQLTCDSVLTISGSGAMADWGSTEEVPWYSQYRQYIKSVVIQEGVTSISSFAFYYCSTMQSISIPASVINIGQRILYGNASLMSISVAEANPVYDSSNNCNAFIETATNTLIAGCNNTIIPEGIVTIREYAFLGCSQLDSIIIPSSVNSIGLMAFAACNVLASIVIDAGNVRYDSRNNCNAIIETSTNTLIAGCKNTIIPNSVTRIADQAFYGCSSLHSIVIPNSVVYIGSQVFHGSGLTAPTYNNRIFAFMPTSYSEGYVIPDGIETIADWAFASCSNLPSITLPNSLKTIDNYAFYNCRMLENITLPDSVISIGHAAFEYCLNLQSINIPNSVTSIGGYAFFHCEYLTSIILPQNITDIGHCTFEECGQMNSITLPDSLIYINQAAFYNCKSLTSITIPEKVEFVGDHTFFGCIGLTSITCKAITPPSCFENSFDGVNKSIPLYVPYKSIAAYQTAEGWSEFTNILPILGTEPCIIASGTCGAQGDNLTWELSCDSVLTISGSGAMADWSYDMPWRSYTRAIKQIILPSGLTHIGNYAFYDCKLITSIEIPDSVVTIGAYAFNACSNLKVFTAPKNLQHVYASAFMSCTALDSIAWNAIEYKPEYPDYSWNTVCPFYYIHNQITSFTIADDVVYLPHYLFYQMVNLKNIVLLDTVNEVGLYLTEGCDFEDPIYNRWLFLFMPKNYSGAYTLPDSIEVIYDNAFENCSTLTSLIAGENLYRVGDEAFKNCSALTSVKLPVGTEVVGSDIFYGCTNLQELEGNAYCLDVEEPNWVYFTKNLQRVVLNSGSLTANSFSVLARSSQSIRTLDIENTSNTNLSDKAFKEFYNMQSLKLPANLTYIGYKAVAECVSLKSIEIPASVIEIGDRAFEDCRSLDSIYFGGNSLRRIGNWAFYNAHALRHLTIPEGVEEIGDGAFYDCTYLTDFTLPASVLSIGDNGFSLCTKLNRMEVRAIIPPDVKDKTFYEVSTEAPVYVPDGSVATYKAHPVWGRLNIVGLQDEAMSIDNLDATSAPQKTLHDGQLFILRGDKTYSITGQEVK